MNKKLGCLGATALTIATGIGALYMSENQLIKLANNLPTYGASRIANNVAKNPISIREKDHSKTTYRLTRTVHSFPGYYEEASGDYEIVVVDENSDFKNGGRLEKIIIVGENNFPKVEFNLKTKETKIEVNGILVPMNLEKGNMPQNLGYVMGALDNSTKREYE